MAVCEVSLSLEQTSKSIDITSNYLIENRLIVVKDHIVATELAFGLAL